MSDEDGLENREYSTLIGKPYLTKDAVGTYVILRAETIFSAPTKDGNVDQCYTTEALVDPAPSEKTIFAYKLKGAFRECRCSVARRLKDS